MKVGILSDIHSNKAALKAVLDDLSKEGINEIIILGDIFGYYPWASETYKLLQSKTIIAAVKGNHDLLVEEETSQPIGKPEYYEAAQLNRKDLQKNAPEALDWLANLKLINTIIIANYNVTLCHGNPDDTANGRYYPDNANTYNWFPGLNEILLLGHTHYPLFKKIIKGGVLFNPGSVGQPRDGNPFPSWGIWDSESNSFEIRRTEYDCKAVINELVAQNWNKRAILALSKDYTGSLNI